MAFFLNLANDIKHKIICIITNINQKGISSIATAYRIAVVKADHAYFPITVTILKIKAINVTIICGAAIFIAKTVPIAVPNSSAVSTLAVASAYVDET